LARVGIVGPSRVTFIPRQFFIPFAALPRDKSKGADPDMGRGRAKAKQTKVARDLKYRSVDTDFASLERELRGHTDQDDWDGIPDQYADLAKRYDEDDVEVVFDEDDR
jgi:hypothetical protein